MEFGEKVRIARESRGLSREELAKMLNVSIATVSRIENSISGTWTEIANVKKLSKILNILPDYFFNDNIKSLEDIKILEKAKNMLNDEKYLDYAVIVHYAISRKIPPELLKKVIELAVDIYESTQ